MRDVNISLPVESIVGSSNGGIWRWMRRPEVAIALLAIAAVSIRLSGQPDLMDNEQQLQSSYVMDALQNHHWAIQKDDSGQIASKPPMYTWLAAAAVAPF